MPGSFQVSSADNHKDSVFRRICCSDYVHSDFQIAFVPSGDYICARVICAFARFCQKYIKAVQTLLCLQIEEGSIYGHSPVVMVILSQGALRIGASDSLGECPYLMID